MPPPGTLSGTSTRPAPGMGSGQPTGCGRLLPQVTMLKLVLGVAAMARGDGAGITGAA